MFCVLAPWFLCIFFPLIQLPLLIKNNESCCSCGCTGDGMVVAMGMMLSLTFSIPPLLPLPNVAGGYWVCRKDANE